MTATATMNAQFLKIVSESNFAPFLLYDFPFIMIVCVFVEHIYLAPKQSPTRFTFQSLRCRLRIYASIGARDGGKFIEHQASKIAISE